MDDERRRCHARAARAAALAGLVALVWPGSAQAFPAHDWDYPFCGQQPVITAVYDHEYPTYGCPPNGAPGCIGNNATLRLYNNAVNNRLYYEGHNGWDYATRGPTPSAALSRVHAAEDGVVTYAGWHRPGQPGVEACDLQVRDHEQAYGLMLRVRHGARESLYAHLGALLVETGDTVARGQVIATAGSTGNSTGPHLHYGAFEPHGTDIGNSFDPYGWNADWRGTADLPLPLLLDPWYRESGRASRRVILPGAPDNEACPTQCADREAVVVDDLDPGFTLGCAGPPCAHWYAAGQGYQGHLYYTYANGNDVDHWASWTAPLGPGTYEVEVYVPLSRTYGTAHAARYRVGGPDAREVVVDQHEEGDVWVSIGIHDFDTDPSVTLTDATYIDGNWSYVGTCRNVAADAVRFTPICPTEGSHAPGASG